MYTQKRKYFGCKISQRGKGNSVDFFAFVATVKDIMQWADIKRIGEHTKGVQRILKGSRTRAIKRFFESDLRNTIPVSVLVAFPPKVAKFRKSPLNIGNIDNGVGDKLDWGFLSFSAANKGSGKPALIVDGQHRLNGMLEVANENLPVLVTALVDTSGEEQAFQFVVINKKAEKVLVDNVKAIVASQYSEKGLQDRLLNAGINYGEISATLKDLNDEEDSPFYHLLDWPLNPDKENRLIQLTTIEACFRYMRTSFPIIENEEDTLKEVFLTIWKTIANHYSSLWKARNYKFLSKLSLTALNEHIIDRIVAGIDADYVDIDEPDQIESNIRNSINSIPSEFWTRDWLIDIQDNAVIRRKLKEDFRRISQNAKSSDKEWDDKLSFLAKR